MKNDHSHWISCQKTAADDRDMKPMSFCSAISASQAEAGSRIKVDRIADQHGG